MTYPLNGTIFMDQPWNTTWSPFTDLIGAGFFLIPVSFIGLALFMKTRDPVMISAYMIISGALLTTGGLFAGYMSAVPIYIIFTALGVGGLIWSLFFGGK